MGGSIGIASLDTLITRFSAQHYNDLMASVNALSPTAYRSFMSAAALGGVKMSSGIGLWNPQVLAVKSLYGRVQAQVFVMSFEQLCWFIVAIVACGLIPLAFIKPKNLTGGPVLDAH
jgi:DHA2 family multidrug resistance protein